MHLQATIIVSASRKHCSILPPNVSVHISNPDNRNQLRYAVDWMIRKGVKIINVSLDWPWDGPGDGSSPFRLSIST